MDIPWFIAIPVLAALISVLALWVIGLFGRDRGVPIPEVGDTTSHRVSFLFQAETLKDHDVPASTMARDTIDALTDWAGLRAWFGRRFGALPEALASLSDDGHHVFQSSDRTGATLTVQSNNGAHRVILSQEKCPDPAAWHELMHQLEVGEYRTDALNHTPCAIWITNKENHVIWRNDVFLAFSPDQINALTQAALADPQLQRITIDGGRPRADHYEIQSTPGDHYSLHFASNVSAVVEAESVRREFVQTLTKTFANLTTGLAVFNRARELALFNPALVDLTMLPVEFLSSRPSLLSFFDNLRDHQVMPEPKSYPDWRAMINQMIETASGGLYSETWSLPSGLTYRVTGRPHPDGAVAFLIEDISNEVASNRRFRAQLDLRQSVIDRVDEAIAVIGPNRALVFCNVPFASMLQIDPDNSFAELSFDDLLTSCRGVFPDRDFWDKAADTVSLDTRTALAGQVTHDNGATYQCRFSPLPGETTMLSLARQPEPALIGADPVT